MNGIVFLLCFLAMLGAVLCEANVSQTPATTFPSSPTPPITDAANAFDGTDETSSSISTLPPTTVSRSPSTLIVSRTTSTPNKGIFRMECLHVFVVCGGLILACIILLMSTMWLCCKVCQLNRHIKALSSNADLISLSEYRMGTAKEDKAETETEGANETTVLMADVEMGNGTAKEEAGKVKGEGQMEEENKKEVEDTGNNIEEVQIPPPALEEDSSTFKPQEQANDTQTSQAMSASPSEGTEEPEVVV